MSGSGLYFVDCNVQILLAMADAPLAVFASAKVHRIKLLAFNDSVLGRGLK